MKRVRLAAGWSKLDTSAKEAQGKGDAIHVEGQREAAKAKAARASALAEKGALAKHCKETEDSFKALQERIVET
ncbi:hypothetical protein D1007_41163 [Hordeum vulgare]|nr:hypothetical protein D1007_41163 [Hordeum vulgare]